MRKIYSSKKLENIDLKKIRKKVPFNKETINVLKHIKLKIEEFKLKMNIGTEDAVLTSYIVAIIASILSIILPQLVDKKDIKKCKYIINPIYNNNLLNLHLDSIISIKIVHIIYAVIYFIINNKESERNERTSNRRTYAYSHEFN